MLDLAKVTADDVVIDLGSGDGRNVIGAANRGAKALGVEFNVDLVELSKRQAIAAGVDDKASFVQGDMYESDISGATVLVLFLLPENLEKLRPKFLDLAPGTRIVGNTFEIPDWRPDEIQTLGGDCKRWCTLLLWIVPANVQGRWRLPEGDLDLRQEYQTLQGSLTSTRGVTNIEGGKVRGDQIKFRIGAVEYTGRIAGGTITGTKSGGESGNWKATRAQ
jgi:hypothetical protein